MDVKEFDNTLTEAETLLDRLRGLYEQWFQGMERLEPTVPRKEMDRRVQAMRRAVPRNTALRFRFNRLVQKYLTYQTYWKRIARQIEEGTYRRDLLKARERRMDRRKGIRREREEPNTWEIDIDVDLDQGEFFDAADVDSALAAFSPGAAPAASPPPRAPALSLSPFAAGSLRPAGTPGDAAPAPPEDNRDTPPAPPPAAALSAHRKTPPAPAPTGRTSSPGFDMPGPTPSSKRPSQKPVTRSFAPPRPDGPPAPRQALPNNAYRPSSPSELRPRGPAKAPPRAAPVRPAPARPAPARPAPARPAPGADDGQIRRVFDTYVEARRRNNERVDNLKYDTVAKSIKKMLPKLQEKHKGKRIDFEVVVKNGKVGIKPVPK